MFTVVYDPVLFIFKIMFITLLFTTVTITINNNTTLVSLFPVTSIMLPASPLSTVIVCVTKVLLMKVPLIDLI